MYKDVLKIQGNNQQVKPKYLGSVMEALCQFTLIILEEYHLNIQVIYVIHFCSPV